MSRACGALRPNKGFSSIIHPDPRDFCARGGRQEKSAAGVISFVFIHIFREVSVARRVCSAQKRVKCGFSEEYGKAWRGRKKATSLNI